jgi:hypothetical protein
VFSGRLIETTILEFAKPIIADKIKALNIKDAMQIQAHMTISKCY